MWYEQWCKTTMAFPHIRKFAHDGKLIIYVKIIFLGFICDNSPIQINNVRYSSKKNSPGLELMIIEESIFSGKSSVKKWKRRGIDKNVNNMVQDV